ncbi:Alpha/Beta hydrolase protein [Plectosphaerella plurivora]|uniref:Alpha/Beta hydrolase protein n=1 Tax=Plectosphaerella plurivora TaxID=936078 RepID=A0A9P8V7D8_9PEZI|nr:Alpha/Beta hydrolase protein [Plectosphaerella plurivora]
MNGQLHFDSDYLSHLLKLTGGHVPTPGPPPTDIAEIRKGAEAAVHAAFRTEPTPENIHRTVIPVTSFDGSTIEVHRFGTNEINPSDPGPAILYVHGGGMIAGSIEIYEPALSRYAVYYGIPFFGVEYRFAPELTGDGLVRDVYAALEHLVSHAKELGIDPARIAIMGDSAGGGIAAGTALMARDRNLQPPIAKQVLVYPMLDDRTPPPAPDSPLSKFLFIWDGARSTLAWAALLGKDKAGKEDADVPIYAAPSRAKDLSNLPETYVEVGGLDVFANEAIDYVGRLVRASVQTEFHLLPGIPHGHDTIPTTLGENVKEAKKRFLRDL